MKFTLIIKKNDAFRYILKNGKYSKGKYIVVHICKNIRLRNTIQGKNYIGICVSKKNGNSVNRNKLKRWAREVYKNEESKLNNNYSIVVLYKKKCTFELIDYKEVKTEMIKCFEELNLYVDRKS